MKAPYEAPAMHFRSSCGALYGLSMASLRAHRGAQQSCLLLTELKTLEHSCFCNDYVYGLLRWICVFHCHR